MKIFDQIEKHFGFILYGGFALALFFPAPGTYAQNWIMPLLMIVMYFTLLKIDLFDVITHIKKPSLIAYLTLAFLILIPVITYYLLIPFDPTLAIGFLLVVAMPPGFGSPTLATLFKGNAALTLATVIICSLLAPFTVPAIFSTITTQELSVDIFGLFRSLAIIIFLPLIASELTKKFTPKTVKKITPALSSLNIIIFGLFSYIIIAGQQEYIVENFSNILIQLIYVFILFGLLHLIGYFLAYWRPQKDRIAISTANTYMNNGVAIVLAYQFFSPEIAVLVVLSDFPWTLMPPMFNAVIKKTHHA